MNEVTRIWYQRSCAKTKVELRRFKCWIQVFHNTTHIASFHEDAVRALLGERRGDAKNIDPYLVLKDH